MRILQIVGGTLALLVVSAILFLFWARSEAHAVFAKTWEITPQDSIPVPWPDPEVPRNVEGSEAPDEDPAAREARWMAAAVERGKALVTTRLGCSECHGADFGGAVVMDVAPVARLAGPNITSGPGGLPADYSIGDFDLILRHGVRRDGRTAMMPAIDYEGLSNKEVSDIYAYMRSFPPVDRALAPSHMGPVLWLQTAFGINMPAAYRIDHEKPHADEPPEAGVTVAYGAHLSKVCRGCHRMTYEGGPIEAGDPSWPPASNLTPHEDGMAGWTQEDFRKSMREGISKDGTPVDPSMPWQLMGQMGDVELDAMFVFFQSLDPLPTGG